MGHVFGDAVPQLAELVEEHGPAEDMPALALVEVAMRAAQSSGSE